MEEKTWYHQAFGLLRDFGLPGWRAGVMAGLTLLATLSIGGSPPAWPAGDELSQTVAAYQLQLEKIDRALEETDRELEALRQELAALSEASLTTIVQNRLDDSFVIESVSFLLDGQSLLSHRQRIFTAGDLTLDPKSVLPGAHTLKAEVVVRGTKGVSRRWPKDLYRHRYPLRYTPQATSQVVVHPGQVLHVKIDIFTDAGWIETLQNEPQVAIRVK